MLLKKFLELEKYPLLIDASNIKSIDTSSVLKYAFEKQYVSDEITYQKFRQFDSSEKILLIDNFHELNFPPKSIKSLIEFLEIQFGKILIFTSNLLTLVPQIEIEVRDIETFSIRPLGYKKRNKLIENFHRITPNNFSDELILEKTRDSFNKINHVLGNKLLPSYPIFILSILQTLTHMSASGLEQTSYGHCCTKPAVVFATKQPKRGKFLIHS